MLKIETGDIQALDELNISFVVLQSRCAGNLLRPATANVIEVKSIAELSYNPAVQEIYCDLLLCNGVQNMKEKVTIPLCRKSIATSTQADDINAIPVFSYNPAVQEIYCDPVSTSASTC